ncbi:MAG: deferrochelatase/peroxidase EfeB [Actinomycetales bacterium]|nr:deferrochelatase/peroxidase EfeB [Actinomycetales bacterium]
MSTREARGPEGQSPEARGLSRRGLFGLAGVGAAGLALGGGAGVAAGAALASAGPAGASQYPFHGAHQAGVTTPAQDRLHFAAFDLAPDATADELRALLDAWTAAAARMTRGLPVGAGGAVDGPPSAPPDDTGEALDLPPAGLTITIGYGPTLFETADGVDRFGLAARRPAALTPLPRFSGDALRPEWTGGDLCIQACADDPQVAVHAVRNLTRIAFGTAVIRWSQLGFGRTSSTSTAQQTPRNLFGFKDGTANLKAEETRAIEENVWVAEGDDVAWMTGGSYLVARKIRMLIEGWDRTRLEEQEAVIGRDKRDGAPLSGGGEFTAPDLAVLPAASHVRLAHPDLNDGIRLLRRGYNYTDGTDELGRLDAGLFFLSFQRDPERFVRVQRSLAGHDALNEYLRHVGSAVFAVPPGVPEGGSYSDALFG